MDIWKSLITSTLTKHPYLAPLIMFWWQAAVHDLIAFLNFKSWDDFALWDYRRMTWTWVQGIGAGILGVPLVAGATAVGGQVAGAVSFLLLFGGSVIWTQRRHVVMLTVTVLAGLTLSACASVDGFNRLSANITRDAITQSELNRCTVHAQPCLSDDQFRAVNLELHKISVAGTEFTKLRIAGTSSLADVSTFLSVVATETAVLSTAFPNGAIAKVLAALTKLQAQAVALLAH